MNYERLGLGHNIYNNPDERSSFGESFTFSKEQLLHPIRIVQGNVPVTKLQTEASQNLLNRLFGGQTKNSRVELASATTSPENCPNMVMLYGNGWDQYANDSFRIFSDAPIGGKPRFLGVNFASEWPDDISAGDARRQIIRTACHEVVTLIGDPDKGLNSVIGAVWSSMQGGYSIINGTQEEILDQILQRINVHFGTIFLNRKVFVDSNDEEKLDWSDWEAASLHQEMKKMAEFLREKGIVQDAVDVRSFCDNDHKVHARLVVGATGEVGEGMAAYGSPELKVMAVSKSGANKVNYNSDPGEKYLAPVRFLTEDGYGILRPANSPDDPLNREYRPSIETTEVAMVQAVKSRIDARRLEGNFPAFWNWYGGTFSENPDILVPIFLPDVATGGIVIQHNHKSIIKVNTDQVELVKSDPDYVPQLDFPCGSKVGMVSLMSALLRSLSFTTPAESPDHPLHGKVVAVHMPGHGMMLIAESTQAIQDALKNHIEYGEPSPV